MEFEIVHHINASYHTIKILMQFLSFSNNLLQDAFQKVVGDFEIYTQLWFQVQFPLKQNGDLRFLCFI